MAPGPPDPMLADEAIRLVPLTPDHEPALADLVQDGDVRTYTRVPTEPSRDFVATWLGTWFKEEIRRDFGIWSRLRADRSTSRP